MAGGLSPLSSIGSSRRSSSRTQGWKSSGAFLGTPVKVKRKKSQQTALQMLHIMQEQKKPHHSLLGKALRGGVHGLETALDYTARPSYAFMEGLREGVGGREVDLGKFYHGLGQGIHAHKRTGFGTIIRERHPGFAKRHKILTPVAGIGVDIASDPTNLLVIGTAAKAGRVAKELLDASYKLRRGELSGKELSSASKAFKDAGDDWKYHSSLAEHELKGRHVMGQSERMAEKIQSVYHTAAEDELKTLLGPRNLALQLKIPFSRAGTKGVGLMQHGKLTIRTPLRAPSLKRIAERKGIVGNVSRLVGGPAVAERIGRAAKPGWDNDKFHALEMHGKHTGEQLTREHITMMQGNLSKFLAGKSKLTEQEIRDALDKGVKSKTLIVGEDRLLNKRELKRLVKSGQIDNKQAEFLTAWHDYTEYLRANDQAFNVHYQGDLGNKLYIPSVRSRFGQAMTPDYVRGSSHLTKHGFTYERVSKGRKDMELLAELEKSGAKDLITDPITLLAMRARRGAQAQASSTMAHIIATAEGVPVRVLDQTKLRKLENQHAHWSSRKADIEVRLGKFAGSFESKHETRRLRKLVGAESRFVSRRDELMRNIRSQRAKLGAATKRAKKTGKVPSFTRLLTMSDKQLTKGFKASALKSLLPKLRALRAERAALTRIDRKFKSLTPSTGKTVHGKYYKALLNELLEATGKGKFDKSEYLLPLAKGDSWKARFEDAYGIAKHYHSEDVAKARAGWDKIRPKAGAPIKATIKRQQNALERHEAKYAEEIKAIEAEHEARKAIPNERLEDRMVRDSGRLDNINAKLSRVEEYAANPQAFSHLKMGNPEVEARGLSEVPRLVDEHGNPLAITKEMHAGLARMQSAVQDDHFLEEFGRTWNRVISKWKVGVTVINPGYRIRNTISDAWNMYIDGVPAWGMARYGARAAHLMEQYRKGNPVAIRIIDEAYRHGTMSGLFEGDILRVRAALSARGSTKDLASRGRLIAATAKIATDINRHAENWGRLTHYLYRLEYERMPAAEAARHVRSAHFDYEDLTPFERKLKGSLVPFYTWTRKNIPYQLTQLASRPGRYSAFPKIRNEFEQASGDNDGQIQPSWIKQGLGFHVPWGGKGAMTVPQFGPTDIEKVQHPMQLLNMVSPLIKTPAELAFNKSLLTGAPIYGSELKHPRTPISGAAASVFKFLPGSNIGTTARRSHGKMVRGPGANPILSYLSGQTPATNLFVNQTSNIKKSQRGGNKALTSWLSGFATYTPDQESMLSQLSAQDQLAFSQYVRGLRDERRWPETKRKKSKFNSRLEKILRQKHGGR